MEFPGTVGRGPGDPEAMVQEASKRHDDIEQLRRRFEEFRSANPVRSRFPEAMWLSAAELAKRHGVNTVARALGLAVPSLRKWVEKSGEPAVGSVSPQGGGTAPSAFVEFLAPTAGAVSDCSVEVEAAQGGRLRLELKGIATSEVAKLIRAFVGH